MLQRAIITTADGSATIALPGNITYHSTYGAVQESMHVFIQSGLQPLLGTQENMHILEIGLGTGLNVLLTAREALQAHQQITYTAIEKYPLTASEVEAYPLPKMNEELRMLFYKMHQCGWQQKVQLHPLFTFEKIKTDLLDIHFQQQYHLIYFDAFDPGYQPELWTETIFEKLYNSLFSKGVLVTYSSKGAVRRALQSAGFLVQKLKGPPGKREITSAHKP